VYVIAPPCQTSDIAPLLVTKVEPDPPSDFFVKDTAMDNM
jgi:hypothetical protein